MPGITREEVAAASVQGRRPASVSVIVPCHNHGRYLPQAIESVLRQTYSEAEIIVIDDGSSDDTPAVARRYPNVRYERQSNRGLSAARNRGLAIAGGEAVVFLDADDVLEPDALRTGVERLANHRECAFVAGRCVWVNEKLDPIETPPQPHVTKDHYRQLLRFNCIYGCMTAMFRTAAIRSAGGFDETLKAAEDWDLYLRLARRHEIHCHHLPIALYRRSEGTLSRNSAVMLGSTLRLLARQARYTRGDASLEAARLEGIAGVRELYGGRLVEEIRGRARAGDWPGMARRAVALLRLHPSAFRDNALRRLTSGLGRK